MFHTNDTGQHIINSMWHGIPDGANADRCLLYTSDAADEGLVKYATRVIRIDSGKIVSDEQTNNDSSE